MLTKGKLINPEIRVENTNFCNANCVMCPRDKMTRPKVEMCWGVFCSIVDQGIELGADTVSVFGYGEPLMDNGLEDKIQYCSDKRMNTWITTNASLLPPERIHNLIGAGLKNIRFSVHAVTPYHYDKIHRNLSWLETFRNIGNFVHMNDKRGHPVTVHLTCIPMNGEPTDQIIEIWQKNIDFIEIWKPHNWGGKKHFRKSDPKKKTCGRPFNGPVQIQSDGSVIPCCFLTDGEVILGNIHDDRLVDIISGERYEKFRSLHRIGNYDGVPCKTCDQRNIEKESPLIYSSRDPEKRIGRTSTCKMSVEQTSTT